jgi:hypothetical protein
MATASHVALVAPSGLSAVGALSFYISIRQEAITFGTEGQLDLFGINVATVHEDTYHFLRAIVTGRIVSVSEEIEIDAHTFEDLVKMLVVSGDERFGSHSQAFGIYYNGSSMGVRATYEEHIFAHLLQSSNKDVRRYIGSQMAQMTGAIGIGQAAGY